MKLLIGCPVRKREWILPTWKQYALKSAANAGLVPEFLFVAGVDDLESCTWDDSTVIAVDEPAREDVRRWGSDRLQHMVELRNLLLCEVRKIEPTYFLSLDSDILLHPKAIEGMLEHMNRSDVWAVGGKAFMAPGRDCPSYAIFNNGRKAPWAGFHRRDSNGVMEVDILMAVKMMKSSAYGVDYVFHKQGEDVGWSLGVTNAGGALLWDGRYCSKHVMKPSKLEQVDVRSGY